MKCIKHKKKHISIAYLFIYSQTNALKKNKKIINIKKKKCLSMEIFMKQVSIDFYLTCNLICFHCETGIVSSLWLMIFLQE